ncbi:hypothetical protein [Actinopolymorpha pittospori]|uniref:Uncharacterized protein n=1 Tax=Actinopolymorpha pittospori TaxID=648752 RepID=A0A927N0D6_9ACTN|nr:hypothetical protein [Actinopolymorpha pittospori]MBE1606415.1 hypothetical protein [Actinopolymorpha pittospori]
MSDTTPAVVPDASYAERFKARLIEHGYQHNIAARNAYTVGVLAFLLEEAIQAACLDDMRAQILRGLAIVDAFDQLCDTDTDTTLHNPDQLKGDEPL